MQGNAPGGGPARAEVRVGDAWQTLVLMNAHEGLAGTVDCCITSPPYYGLRDYGNEGQLGLEATPEEYVQNLVETLREVREALREEGTLWLNLGDSYSRANRGTVPERSGPFASKHDGEKYSFASPAARLGGHPTVKEKDLLGIPWRVALALQADGWYLRCDIIWAKPNPMPEAVKDRPTRMHEYLFLLAKSPHYYYDQEAVLEPWTDTNWGDISRAQDPSEWDYAGKHAEGYNGVCGRPVGDPGKGRNKRSVWSIPTQCYPGAHFATFPEKLVEPCVLAGSREHGLVLDPFTGSGTTGAVACRLGRSFLGIELNPAYAEMARKRICPIADQGVLW